MEPVTAHPTAVRKPRQRSAGARAVDNPLPAPAAEASAPAATRKRPASRKSKAGKPWPHPGALGLFGTAPCDPQPVAPAPAETFVPEPGPLPDFPSAQWLMPLATIGVPGRVGLHEERAPEREPEPEFQQVSLDAMLDGLFERQRPTPAEPVVMDAGTVEQLKQLADPANRALDTACPEPWSEEEIVYLHWKLLRSIACIADPRVSLIEQISVLRWVFVDDPEADEKPFSFVQCLRVVGCSPLTNVKNLPYVGRVDPAVVRETLEEHVRRQWMVGAFDCYPLWLREDIANRPDYYMQRLEKDPMWLSKKLTALRMDRAQGQESLF